MKSECIFARKGKFLYHSLLFFTRLKCNPIRWVVTFYDPLSLLTLRELFSRHIFLRQNCIMYTKIVCDWIPEVLAETKSKHSKA